MEAVLTIRNGYHIHAGIRIQNNFLGSGSGLAKEEKFRIRIKPSKLRERYIFLF